MGAFRFLLLLILTIIITNCYGQNKTYQQEKIKNKIADSIAGLPEVIKADNYCQKLSKGKRHLVTFVWGDPTKEENYYSVKVAEDNGGAYHAWFLFEVYPITYKIYYLNTTTGKLIPLKTWRKNFKLSNL